MKGIIKFQGQWTTFYKQFKTGRIDQSRMCNLIQGPRSADYLPAGFGPYLPNW